MPVSTQPAPVRVGNIPGQIVASFTRQLSTMLANGVPLLKALDTLTNQEEYPDFGVVVEHLAQEISDGSQFSQAVALYPQAFPAILVTMIQVGEQTGRLERTLALVADWLEREVQVRQRLVSAFTYPAGILVVTLALSLLLFTTVLPTFANIFREMHVQMPFITRLVMSLTAVACNPAAWVAGLILTVVGWKVWEGVWRSPAQARLVFRFLLALPGVGSLLKNGSLTRYCAAAEALLASGIDLIKTARLAGQASGNPLLVQDARRMVKAIEMGELVSTAMSESVSLYSIMLLQLIQAGEEASLLPQMYGRASRFHELELDTAIEVLTATLEPLMLLGVAVMVGTIVLSIYLPMYSTLMNLAS